MQRAHFCVLALVVLCLAFTSATFAQTPSAKAIGNDVLIFEETGNPPARDTAAYSSSVSGLNFQFHDSRAAIDVEAAGPEGGAPIHLDLAGGNRTPRVTPQGPLPTLVSHFPSRDTRTWRTGLRTWSGLKYEAVYPGIDLVYYGSRGQLEYDFIVAPHRDPARIGLRFRNAASLAIDNDGGLTVSAPGTTLRFSKPVVYQIADDGSRRLLDGRYIIAGTRVGFDVPAWDHSRPLVIDPTLVWSSFEDSTTPSDSFTADAIDGSSNLYLAGRSGGLLLVQKLSPDGKTVVYRATFGSAYSATVEDIRVDASGNAYIVGSSNAGFPTTAGAFIGGVTSGSHAFVAKVNATGTSLLYATYLAGTTSATDQANGVAVDSAGKIYVTGFTTSSSFPTTTGVIQTKNTNGGQTGFISKIDPTLSGAASLIYSTLLSGPTQQSTFNAIAVDGSGDAFVTGNAGSDFPTSNGSFQYDGEGVGQGGVYVTKINPAATSMLYSAYIGVGTANGIAVDGAGNVYLAGSVAIEDFPTTSGAYQIINPGGFATELNAAGTALVYSTFLSGPSLSITPTDIAIPAGCASACNAFIVGYTGGNDLPLTAPIQNFNASFTTGFSGNDAFVTELNPTGTAAVYSTYLGGTSDESTFSTAHSPSIAVNSTGDAFITGETSSTDFPVTLTTTPQRQTFAVRIGAATTATAVLFPGTLTFSSSQAVGVPSTTQSLTLRNMGSTAMTISSITPAPATDYSQSNTCGTSLAAGAACTITVTFTPSTTGVRPGTLTVASSANNTPSVANLTGSGIAQPFLTLTPGALTFAPQSVNTASASQPVIVGNSGKSSLTFGSPAFNISPNFFQTNNCPATLAAGGSCTVNISFLPTQSGAFNGTLNVSSNTNFQATSFVNLAGTGFIGSPAVTLSAGSMVFGPQVIGTTSFSQFISMTNTGNTPVSIFGVSVTGDYAETGCVNVNLNPGGACTVRVTFSPTATGARAGKVTFADSTPAGSHSFTTTGTGVAPTMTLSMTPPAVSFPDTAVGGASANFTVQTSNTGNVPVAISRVFTTGDFRIVSTGCIQNLRATGICNTTLQFTPTATGSRVGTLVFEDNGTGSPQSVTLSGTGIAAAPGAITSPGALNFGTQAQGTTTPNALQANLTNVGNLAFDASNVLITGVNVNDFQISSQGCQNVLLQPGRVCGVQVTFTPTATGARSANLTFTNAAGTQNVALTGNGVAATFALGFTPASLAFQAQQKGVVSPQQTVWFRNTGTAAVTVSKFASSTTDYQVSGCVGFPIQPNTSCQASVALDPTVTGTDNATLTVTSNATGSPQTINATGSGAATLASLQLLPAGLAFNNQVVGTTSSGQFVTLQNNSSASITTLAEAVAGTNASDFTISSNNCTATLNAATSCNFQVTFKPGAAGARVAQINVTGSAGTQTITLAGFGVTSTISAQVQDSALSFPTQTLNFTSPQQSIIFQNTGNSPFTISSVVLGGTNPGDFSIVSNGCPISPTQFNASSTCFISVNFTPTVAGTRTATVTITDAAPGSPRTITLTGKGVSPVQGLEITPAKIVFTPQVDTTPSPLNPFITVTNTGTAPVNIASVVLGGTNPGDFQMFNNCPTGAGTSLPQGPLGNTCTITVTFTPVAAGARSATITITDSAPGSPTVINLSGTGIAPVKTVVVTPTSLAFNPQVTGTTSPSLSFTVTNTGNFNVTFTNVTITTGFALSNGCVGTLPPQSACTVNVTFTPTTTGAKTGTVTVTDDATGSPQKVTLTGTGISTAQEIQLSQTTVTFDAQPVSTQSPPQLVYYSNQSNVGVTISTVTAPSSEFSLSGSSCVNGTTVGSDSFCIFRITFTPSATGTRTSSFTITDGAPGSPRTINLSGTGVTGNVPEALITPSSLTFPLTAEGTTSAPMTLNFTNNGTGPMIISGVTITGTNPGDFQQTNNCPIGPSTLAAGFSCTISVTFSPTNTGTRTANVSVADNATGSPHTATLTGSGKTGALPIVTLAPTSLTFTNIALNTLSSQPVKVTNTGTAALNITNIAVTGATVSSDFSETDNCVGASIAVSAFCTITVKFTPSTFEPQTATITITDNAANSPQSVPVTANGAAPAVFLSTGSLTFPTQTVGTTSAPQTVTIENYGNATLTFTGITTAAPFILSANTCGASLAPGVSCTISVEFKPAATGTVKGTVVLQDNAGDIQQTIALTGTGG